MASMNRQLNLPQIQRILQEFEKQSEIMDMKEEVMNDAIDDAMEGDDDEEERYFTLNISVQNTDLCTLFSVMRLLIKY